MHTLTQPTVPIADSLPNSSVETQLLLVCARSLLHPDSEAAMALLQQNPNIDWSQLLEQASHHKLLPLLGKTLQSVEPALIPVAASQQLQALIFQNTVHTLELTAELLRLLKIFKTRNIPVIPFKGPTLEAWAYGEVALRTCNDLDFLLQPADYLRLKTILAEAGYRAQDNWFMDAAGEVAYHTMMGEYVLEHTHKKICLDIHVRLAAIYPFFLPTDFSAFWQRLQPVKLGEQEVFTLCPADMLIYLCVHGSRDRWETLSAICDVAALVHRHPQFDWQQLLTEAQRLRVERMLLLGLYLAQQLLHLPLPALVQVQIAAQPMVQRLAQAIMARFLGHSTQSHFDLLGRSFFYLFILDCWQDKLHLLTQLPLRQLQLASLINTRDYEFFPLPRSLYPLYYLIRPIRLLAQYRFGLLKVLFP